jgi:hypothetical protein
VRELRRQQIANSTQLQQAQLQAAENAQLRRLLDARQHLPVKSMLAEVLYDARDVNSRKIILDRGTRHDVTLGLPVIDNQGVVGQVTRVFPFTSEVTLLTDKEQAIPVQLLRNGLRSVAYGRGKSGNLELRFTAPNADIQVGDIVVTSGLDGVYPAGLAVARDAGGKQRRRFVRRRDLPAAGRHHEQHPAADSDVDAGHAAASARRRTARASTITRWRRSRTCRKRAGRRARRRRGDGAGGRSRPLHLRRQPATAPAAPPAPAAVPTEGAGTMNRPHYILLPVSPLFIAFSLFCAFCSTCCRGASSSACPISSRWCWCSGACTSRARSASAPPSSWAC